MKRENKGKRAIGRIDPVIRCPGCNNVMGEIDEKGDRVTCFTNDCKYSYVFFNVPFIPIELEVAEEEDGHEDTG